MTKLIVTISDKTIEARIKPAEEAKEKYDDALASGNSAVYADQDVKENCLNVLIGNLPPNQTAVVNLQLITPLKIQGGAYELSIPLSFLPNYTKHEPIQIKDNSHSLLKRLDDSRIKMA